MRIEKYFHGSQKVHDFYERLTFSEGVADGEDLMLALTNMVQGDVKIRRANEEDDRNGTDYWIDRPHGLPSLSIDLKRRSFCPIKKWGTDDACIETTSVYVGEEKHAPWKDEYRKSVGWTLDNKKRTDFIAYTWPAENGTRYWIVPFVPLCRAANVNWRAWTEKYNELPAWNDGYKTLSVYPLRQEIARAIQVFMRGVA